MWLLFVVVVMMMMMMMMMNLLLLLLLLLLVFVVVIIIIFAVAVAVEVVFVVGILKKYHLPVQQVKTLICQICTKLVPQIVEWIFGKGHLNKKKQEIIIIHLTIDHCSKTWIFALLN